MFNFDYDIAVWKIVYTSRDIAGEPVDVSGLIIVPQGLSSPAPVGSYAHGTIFADKEAPSSIANIQNNDQTAIGLAFATGGYVMFLSDYQAHGESEGDFSLYVAQLEANDIINGLRATQSLCLGNGVALNGNVSLYGYSQGAHVVLAAQRELEKYPIAGVNLLVNIAGSGPYDLSGVQLQFLLDNPQYSNPAIIAGFVEGYQRVYGNIYQNPKSAYAYPEIPEFYNRQLTRDEINLRIADLGVDAWTEMFTPALVRDLKTKPYSPLRADLRRNNVYNWRPKNDVKLCYCSQDELVSPLNTFRALFSFYLKGAFNARVVPLGPYGHFPCAQYTTLVAKLFFDAYNERPNGLLASARSAGEADARKILSTQVSLTEYDWVGLNDLLGPVSLPDETLEQYPVQSSLLVYPNPASILAHLRLPLMKEDGVDVQLYDHTGRLVKRVTAFDADFTLDISDVPDGLYLVKAGADEELSIRMIIRK